MLAMNDIWSEISEAKAGRPMDRAMGIPGMSQLSDRQDVNFVFALPVR
jgi:hypothetical protein